VSFFSATGRGAHVMRIFIPNSMNGFVGGGGGDVVY